MHSEKIFTAKVQIFSISTPKFSKVFFFLIARNASLELENFLAKSKCLTENSDQAERSRTPFSESLTPSPWLLGLCTCLQLHAPEPNFSLKRQKIFSWVWTLALFWNLPLFFFFLTNGAHEGTPPSGQKHGRCLWWSAKILTRASSAPRSCTSVERGPY